MPRFARLSWVRHLYHRDLIPPRDYPATGGASAFLEADVTLLTQPRKGTPFLVLPRPNAFFGLLLSDRNLLLRGVGTLILSALLLWLYARAKRSVLARRTA